MGNNTSVGSSSFNTGALIIGLLSAIVFLAILGYIIYLLVIDSTVSISLWFVFIILGIIMLFAFLFLSANGYRGNKILEQSFIYPQEFLSIQEVYQPQYQQACQPQYQQACQPQYQQACQPQYQQACQPQSNSLYGCNYNPPSSVCGCTEQVCDIPINNNIISKSTPSIIPGATTSFSIFK